MNQNIIKSLNLDLAEIMKSSAAPEEKLERLRELNERADVLLVKGSKEKKRFLTVFHEVSGNQYVSMKNMLEAEKQYRKMMTQATELFKGDSKQFDLLYAQANLRMAVFYKTLLNVKGITQKPVALNEKQKPVYDQCVRLFQNAVKLSYEKAKTGSPAALELQGKCMNHLLILKALVGEYDEAMKIGEHLVKLGKALFQAADDAPHALTLADWMVHLATIYTMRKEYVKAMETHEDCVYVLEDKQEANPPVFGVRLASAYINLGNVCTVIPEEQGNVEAYYQKGIALFEKLNHDYQNKFEKEEARIRGLVENYYKKKRLS